MVQGSGVHGAVMVHCGPALPSGGLHHRTVGGGSLEVHRHRALEDGVRCHIHGIHGAGGCGAAGEHLFPVVLVHANGVIIAADGRGLFLGALAGQGNGVLGLPIVIGVPHLGVVVALGRDCGHVLNAVVHPIQIVAEPLVQDFIVGLRPDHKLNAPRGIGGGQVSILMEQELGGHPGLLIGLVHQVKLLGPHVVVVQAVHNEGRALNLIGVQGIVPVGPVVAVIPVGGQLVLPDLIEVVSILAGNGVPVRLIQVPAGAVPGQPVAVSGVAPGGNALGVGILIPAGNPRHGDDGLQPLHPSGGQAELGGAGVGPPGHPHLAVGPVCLNGDVAGLVRIGNPLAVEPLNHALERVDLQVAPAGFKAL